MSGIMTLGIIAASGIALATTINYAIKAYHNFLNQNKGLDQQTRLVTCPNCGSENKRQKHGQSCQRCYQPF
ncbi:hypothetical protein Q73_08680 [Bacillus coahuilensis m2-6]|uniref:Uncharacterized protein n=1 Tax=Bacillus coahuilensis p1.1.43 TaxID=1150625 RepID=A0A147K8A4_9BACI|nr:hypothetical protein Q75_09160 [Bacillus coahuilensis p1.1.43]KUP07448.1 hypothetical protein Q73_08680 [Bacillus coahuilensis m2-6]